MHVAAKELLEKKRVYKTVKAVDEHKRLNIRVWLSKEEAMGKFASVDENSKQSVIEAQLNLYREVLLCERKIPRTMFTKKLKKTEGNLSCNLLFERLEIAIDFLALPDGMENVPTKTVLKTKVERDNLYIEQREIDCV